MSVRRTFLLISFVAFGAVGWGLRDLAAETARLDYPSGVPDQSDYESKVQQLLKVAAVDFEKAFRSHRSTALRVTVLPLNELQKLVRTPSWAVGIYHQGTIYIPNTPGALESQNLRRTIRHEYVHAVIDQLSAGKSPAWLDEGLAQLFEGSRLGRSDFYELRDAFAPAQHLSLEALDKSFISMSRRDALQAYRLSLFASERLLLVSSPPQIVRFFELLSEGKPIASSFRDVFAVSLDAFEASVLAALQRRP